LIVDNTPLFRLHLIEINKDRIHGISIDSIVKLVEVDIIKDAKVVKDRRYYSSRCWNGNQEIENID
jgi:hypothetical protein